VRVATLEQQLLFSILPVWRHIMLEPSRKNGTTAASSLYRGAPLCKSFHLYDSEQRYPLLVAELMSPQPAVCTAHENLEQAAKRMWEADRGVLPVLDEAERVVAMLTDRDICMAAYTQGRPLREISVRTAMSQQLHSCFAEDTLEHAEQLMIEHQIRRIPVLDAEGRLLGILSLSDLAQAAARVEPGAAGGCGGRSLTATARTLAAVSAPRLLERGPTLS